MATFKDLVKSEESHRDDINNSTTIATDWNINSSSIISYSNRLTDWNITSSNIVSRTNVLIDKTNDINYEYNIASSSHRTVESEQLKSAFEHFEEKFFNIFKIDTSSIEDLKQNIDFMIRATWDFLKTDSKIQQDIEKLNNYVEKYGGSVGTLFARMKLESRTTYIINKFISESIKAIDKYARKHGYYIPADQFSFRMYLLDRLLAVIMEKIIEESYKNKGWEIDTTLAILWDNILKQNVNYNNDFILILNDPSIFLMGKTDPDFISILQEILIKAVRQVPIPILVVGAANGDNKKNFPLLSFSGLGWHIEDVTFNATTTMSIQMKDLIINNEITGESKYLHQYFEDFIREFIISDFSNIDSPMQGAFVDELSLSFSLLLFAPMNNGNIKIIKRIDFLFLPLTIELPARDYNTSNISDFSVKGLSIFYKNNEVNKEVKILPKSDMYSIISPFTFSPIKNPLSSNNSNAKNKPNS